LEELKDDLYKAVGYEPGTDMRLRLLEDAESRNKKPKSDKNRSDYRDEEEVTYGLHSRH
jgi:hypothetical protein